VDEEVRRLEREALRDPSLLPKLRRAKQRLELPPPECQRLGRHTFRTATKEEHEECRQMWPTAVRFRICTLCEGAQRIIRFDQPYLGPQTGQVWHRDQGRLL
jgi:hypothetical protein